ncbi:MAG: recombinase [Rickettsiales bacterium TMED254]|nr:MAG: recombinase [Rickettsiales bacterium TMED254]|tara:strand:- start:3191 stop:4900 length:1710 start_codon:yes stop_codon:yes gene_type:complete
MIIFEKIRYKNFLSSGNHITEIQLNKSKSTLIVGQNGTGKSTSLDALSFALFGRAHRNITKEQLINSINKKDCVTEVYFTIGKSKFNIIRGIKPNIFEIWKDGIMLNQSSHAKEYQKILEQNILKLNHKSFHQVVVLGSSSFIPFMQLRAYQRRAVIEDLLDINVFSKMNIILKESISQQKDRLKDINYKIDINENKIETQNKYIKDIKILNEEVKEDKLTQIDTAYHEVIELKQRIKAAQTDYDSGAAKTEKNLKEYNDLKQANMHAMARIRSKIESIVKNAKFYEDHLECPTCTQSITQEVRETKIQESKDEAKNLQKNMQDLSEKSEGISNALESVNSHQEYYRELLSDINNDNKEITRLNDLMTKLNKEVNTSSTTDVDKASKELKDMTTSLTKLTDEKTTVSEEFQYSSAMVEMLRDTGIKTKIIKQYLPIINKFVNQYLQILDFFVHFDLDENFQETIKSRHRDAFSYDSFSEGEKQRIDLALLFSWRQIAKMKNSISTNLLILDETFDSSLDHDGVENLLKILYTLTNDTSVFVISHKREVLDDKFENKIEFTKEKNFSKIA